jgi:hypothetical protein
MKGNPRKVVIFIMALVFTAAIAGTTVSCGRFFGGGGGGSLTVTCAGTSSTSIPVTVGSNGVNYGDILVCPGNTVTWSSTTSSFVVNFTTSSPFETGNGAGTYPSSTTSPYTVTSPAANNTGGTSCGPQCWDFDYTVSSASNSSATDPHVIIVR